MGTQPGVCEPCLVASSPDRWGRKARMQVSVRQLPRSQMPMGKGSWGRAPPSGADLTFGNRVCSDKFCQSL